MPRWVFFSFIILVGCSGLEDSENKRIREMNAVGEHIYRSHSEYLFPIETPKKRVRENYPWESACVGDFAQITKELFRCRGNLQHPPLEDAEGTHAYDCGGNDQHSLPLKNGKEYIYPALLEILNYIQAETQKEVVVTCGHRCPAHNTYADASKFNATSKHMIGAEVDFYVRGMEWKPERVINLIEKYYSEHPSFKGDRRFKFQRYEKGTNASTLPWYNKEVFVKLFKKDEGRDFDNGHRYPFIAIQLKWDRDSDELVQYNWTRAFNGYLRY